MVPSRTVPDSLREYRALPAVIEGAACTCAAVGDAEQLQRAQLFRHELVFSVMQSFELMHTSSVYSTLRNAVHELYLQTMEVTKSRSHRIC